MNFNDYVLPKLYELE